MVHQKVSEMHRSFFTSRPFLIAFPLVAGLTILCGFRLLHAFDDRPQPGETMLVLKSGKVVAGVVKSVPGGYMLKRPSGDVLVPLDIVQFEANSLRDAYQKYCESLTPDERTATAHILLARWCLSQQLYEEAEIELKSAIKLEPRRKEAYILLKKLRDNILDPVTTESLALTSHSSNDSSKTVVLSDGTTQKIQSLAGLSRETALTYTRTIEPILMNKCSNASCHGGAPDNDFQLDYIPFGQGVHRAKSERNLAAVLKFIDVDNPRASPLLTEVTNAHGPDGVSLFLGSVGAKQQKALRNWVADIAREKQTSSRTVTELVDNTRERRSPRTATAHQVDNEIAVDDGNLEPPELLPDPFDPEAFNRQHHGRNVRSAVYESSPTETLPPQRPRNAARLRLR